MSQQFLYQRSSRRNQTRPACAKDDSQASEPGTGISDAWVAVPFTLLVAASRVVLGLHYPSDVLAGGALGALIAMASLSLV